MANEGRRPRIKSIQVWAPGGVISQYNKLINIINKNENHKCIQKRKQYPWAVIVRNAGLE